MKNKISNFFKQAGAYINMGFAIVLIASLVFTIGFGVCLHMMRHEIFENVNKKVMSDLGALQNYIDEELQRVEDLAYTALCNQLNSTVNITSNGERIIRIDTAVPLPSEKEMQVLMEQVIKANPHICGITIGFERGYGQTKGKYGFAPYVTNISGKFEHLQLGALHNYRQRAWYKVAYDTGAPTWTDPFRESSQKKVICSYTYPIYSLQGEKIGVVAIDIDTAPFRKKCSEATQLSNDDAFIFDRNFNFISHPDTALLLLNINELYEVDKDVFDSIQNKMHQQRGKCTIAQIEELKMMLYFCPITRTGWTIGVMCPQEDIYGKFNKIKRITTIIAIVSIFFMLLCLLYLMRRIQRATIAKVGIKRELGVASDIQMGMIPQIYPAFPMQPQIDICGFIKPAKSVGGDLYDYFEHNGKVYFIIGDVSGKGIPASLLMMVIISLFRNVARNHTAPEGIVESINQSIARNNPQMMFCTMFIGILNLADGHMQYCNAGHNYPILCNSTQEGYNVQYMRSESNMPVGIFENAEYAGRELQMNPGDGFFLYTDGVNEAENNQHVQFGEKAALDIIREEMNAHSTSNTVLDTLFKRIMAHANGAEQSDDITMVHLRYIGTDKSSQ